jgi:uncharacterized protein (DUF1330 family)
MPAYFIALVRAVHQRQKLEDYWQAARPTFADTGMKPLAIYTPLTLLEKLGPLEGVVLLEFPDLATAKAWYEGPAYQKAMQHRIGAADAEIFIVDGGVVPPEDRLPQTKNRRA